MSNYFISQAGSDQNPGTEQQPWQTLGATRGRVKAGDTVLLADGIYREPLPLASGVTVKAVNAGKAILDGSYTGTLAWAKDANGIWSTSDPGGVMGVWLGTFPTAASFCCCYDGAYAKFDPTRPGGKVIPGSKSQWQAANGKLSLTTISGGNPNDEGVKLTRAALATSATGLSDVRLEGIATRYWRRAFEAISGKNITLSGCDLGYSSTTAVGLGPVDGLEFAGCTIHGAGSLLGHYEDVIHVEAGIRAKFSGCDIAWGGHGLMFFERGGDFQILGSYLHDSGGSGITLVRNTNGALVDGCWIERCATQRSPSVRDVGSSIQIHGNKHTFRNCVFKGNSKHFLFSATGPGTDNPTTSDNLVDHCTLQGAEENGVEMQEAAPGGEIARNTFRTCVVNGAGLDLLSCWFAGVGATTAGASNRFEGSQIDGGRIRGTAGTYDTVEAARARQPLVYAGSQSDPVSGAGSSLTAPPVPGGGGGGNGGTVPQKPVLVKLEPSTAIPGQTVIATGALFGTGKPVVVMQTKKGTAAAAAQRVPVSSYEDRRVTFTVPDGSDSSVGVGVSGPVFVRNTGLNQSTNSLPLTVTDTPPPMNQPPIADAGGPYVGVVGVPVRFDGSGSHDPDGTIALYHWDFGTSTQQTGPSPSQAFQSPGTYPITLTVKDNQGAFASATTSATITAAQPLPGELRVTVALSPSGAFSGQVIDAQPLPPGTTLQVLATTPDGRAASAKTTLSGTPPPVDGDGGKAAQTVVLVNQERVKAGVPALKVNAQLTAAAQKHAEDMAQMATLTHTGSDGSLPWDRVAREGYHFSTVGENAAMGYSTPAQVTAGWMGSAGHRANILNGAFTETGVGFAPGAWWVQVFAAPAGLTAPPPAAAPPPTDEPRLTRVPIMAGDVRPHPP